MTMDLKFYISLFLRRLPYFLIMVAIGSAIGLTLASVLPPVYVAQSRLVVESEQIPGDLAASTVQTGATEQLQIIQQRILSRASLLDMANALQIYASEPRDRQRSADEIVADLRERIQVETVGGASGRGATQATFVLVSFSAPSADLAATVANQVVTDILEEDVAMRTVVSGQTLQFFQQEVSRLDQELAKTGEAILKFKEANQEALPDSLDFRRSQQATEQARIMQLDRDAASLRERRDRLVALYEATGRVDTVASNETPEQRQLNTLNDQLQGLLAVLSPRNPRVRVLETQIASLEKVIAAQGGSTTDAAGEALSAYDLQLADLDGQLQAMTEQKAQSETQMARLEKSIAATPGNAIALGTLERDYANVRTQYDQAVANKARAETGDLIEALSKGQRISVIEPATAPRQPTSPNRPVIAAAGVGGGLALGLGLVVLLEFLNSSIRRPADLTGKLGITPFATLPYLRTRTELRRRRAIILGAMFAVAAGIPLVLWALNTYVTPLDLLLDQILQRVGIAALTPLPGPLQA